VRRISGLYLFSSLADVEGMREGVARGGLRKNAWSHPGASARMFGFEQRLVDRSSQYFFIRIQPERCLLVASSTSRVSWLVVRSSMSLNQRARR